MHCSLHWQPPLKTDCTEKIFVAKKYLVTSSVFKLQKWFLHQNSEFIVAINKNVPPTADTTKNCLPFLRKPLHNWLGTFNQEKGEGPFSVIVKTDCETDGPYYSTTHDTWTWGSALSTGQECETCNNVRCQSDV